MIYKTLYKRGYLVQDNTKPSEQIGGSCTAIHEGEVVSHLIEDPEQGNGNVIDKYFKGSGRLLTPLFGVILCYSLVILFKKIDNSVMTSIKRSIHKSRKIVSSSQMFNSSKPKGSYTTKILALIFGGIFILLYGITLIEQRVKNNEISNHRKEYGKCINDPDKYIKDKKIPDSEVNKHIPLYNLRNKKQSGKRLSADEEKTLKKLNEDEKTLKVIKAVDKPTKEQIEEKERLQVALYGDFCKQRFCNNMCETDKEKYIDINNCYRKCKNGESGYELTVNTKTKPVKQSKLNHDKNNKISGDELISTPEIDEIEPQVSDDFNPKNNGDNKNKKSSTSSNSTGPCRGIDADPICNFDDYFVRQSVDNTCKDAKGDKRKDCCKNARTVLKDCKDNPKKNQAECDNVEQQRKNYENIRKLQGRC